MVSSYRLLLLMTIEPLWSPWLTSPFPPNLVLYIVKNYYLQNLSSHKVLVVERSNFNTSFFMISSYRLLRFDDDRTIVGAISANLVFYILTSPIRPFRMNIYHMLSVRQVLMCVLYTRPNLPKAELLVMRGLLCWVIDFNGGYVNFSLLGMTWTWTLSY